MELSCTVQHVLPPGEDTPWFDVNGLPLWWQVPLGVLHDLLAAGQKPWRLTVSPLLSMSPRLPSKRQWVLPQEYVRISQRKLLIESM